MPDSICDTTPAHMAWDSYARGHAARAPKHAELASIALADAGSTMLRAAWHAPAALEALAICFPEAANALPPASRLPRSHGFSIESCSGALGSSLFPHAPPNSAILLASRAAGCPTENFRELAAKIEEDLRLKGADGPRAQLRSALRLLADWQFFWANDMPKLSEEREAGLVGELLAFLDFARLGAAPRSLLAQWTGPAGTAHDFQFPMGDMEVKTSMSPTAFEARISSIDQLAPLEGKQLFLLTYKLSTSPNGRSLPTIVAEVEALFSKDPVGTSLFNSKLLDFGYNRTDDSFYERKFHSPRQGLFLVDAAFPKIVRDNAMKGIASVEYSVNLESLAPPTLALADAMNLIGAL